MGVPLGIGMCDNEKDRMDFNVIYILACKKER